MPNSPEFTANLGVEFSKAVTLFGMDGRVAAAADYQYVGTREADIQNSFKLNDYHLVNLRVGLEQDNRSVYAFARNVFDERPEFSVRPSGRQRTASLSAAGGLSAWEPACRGRHA